MNNDGELWLIRHGETEWSALGKHTGRTDVPLNERGRSRAKAIRADLPSFSKVLSSPLTRAFETCQLAGCGDQAEVEPDLAEWDYGVHEGRTTAEIREGWPNWSVWNPDSGTGESLELVASRARRALTRVAGASGKVAIFSHGHYLRILAACWLDLPPDTGRLFALNAGAISILGYERETRVIELWNWSESCVGRVKSK